MRIRTRRGREEAGGEGAHVAGGRGGAARGDGFLDRGVGKVQCVANRSEPNGGGCGARHLDLNINGSGAARIREREQELGRTCSSD